MLGELDTYEIADFIPFTVEVYLRLVERQNAWFGLAAPAMGVGLGIVMLILAWRGQMRTLLALTALAWVSVALTFHLRLYAELTWAAHYLAGAFIVQAALMGAYALLGRQGASAPAAGGPGQVLGYALTLGGLVTFALLAPALGRGWGAAEWFASMPAPTVVATLGVLLIVVRPAWLWLLMPLPLLWCAVTGMVEWTLGLPSAWGLVIAAPLALVGALCNAALGPRR